MNLAPFFGPVFRLVWRLPIATRKGPSLARMFFDTGRYKADPNAERVREHLAAFSQSELHAEINRLLGRTS